MMSWVETAASSGHKQPPIRGDSFGHISLRGLDTADSRAGAHHPHQSGDAHRFAYLDTAAAARRLLRRHLVVRHANRRYAAVTRTDDARNCSKPQIAKWSQKPQFRGSRRRRMNPEYAAEIATPSHRAEKKTTLRGGDLGRRFARPPKRPGSARNQ